jgi:hypothetical protein
MRPRILVIVLGLLMVVYGCASEATRNLNDQNRQAGAMIKQDPAATPATKQAGADVEANSTAMAKELGQPKTPLPYTPANSDDQRKKVPTHWYTGILTGAWGLLGAFVAGGGLANLVGRIAPVVAGPWGGIVTTLVTGIVKGRSLAEAGTVATPQDAIKKMLVALESELSDDGYQGQVKALAKQIEGELDITHQVTIR